MEGVLRRFAQDEEKMQQRCSVCGEPMYQTFDMELGGEVRTVTTPRQCECARLRYEVVKERERKARVEDIRRRAVTDEETRREMQTHRFETADDTPNMRKLRKYVERWDDVKQETGLMLWGSVGTGKTFAANCIANALIDKEVRVFVTNIEELANSVFDDKTARRYAMDRVRGCDLLILDDIGTERESSFMYQKAFDFVDARIKTGKPLIVTTNLSPRQMDEATEQQQKRIFDRIRGATAPIEFAGTSRRAAKASQNVAKLRDILNS